MNICKHTQGPWTRKRQIPADDTVSRLVFAGDDLIATVYDLEDASPEAIANARLIAAAPDLLEALRGLVTTLESMAVHPSHYEAARAAIAKATN